ncbi:MAG: tartrate dehydrogenase [Candidatus Omnitrophica bacterium]|nr:tartrate dehydrogenase [Candidatus Omnitrophota bacterium]MCB9784832.1 tartrate dehydrogenase [Candidatus Omnitrophota bacterium]
MKEFRIAVYPGDGIGVEVTEHTVRLLQALQECCGDFTLHLETFPWGGDYYIEHGRTAPEDYLEILKPFDAIFLGAIGDPARIPDHITLAPLIGIRQSFDQYACVRPARLFEGVSTPLAGRGAGDIDMVVIRENSEGEYIDNGGRFKKGKADEFAVQTALHTRKGIERILHFGFEQARKRKNHLTLITKSNALKYSYVLWDEIFEEMRPNYSDVETQKFHIDAAVMNFVRWPDRFDVVVGSNLFGDILTDLSGCLVGGLGLAPSANINPERDFPSMFEPVHGSAPDIAGKGIANPTAAFLSAAMMLEWLELNDAADRIRRSIESTLAAGETTADLGGTLNSTDYTERVLSRLEASK